MKTIRLPSNKGRLILEVTAPDWVRCTFQHEGREIYLGAESPQYLLARLVRGLIETGHELDGVVDGRMIYRVLSLYEGHYILYMSEEGDERYLFWQDAGRTGNGLQRMHLTVEQRQEWVRKLAELEAET
jgi:hypothetical protein